MKVETSIGQRGMHSFGVGGNFIGRSHSSVAQGSHKVAMNRKSPFEMMKAFNDIHIGSQRLAVDHQQAKNRKTFSMAMTKRNSHIVDKAPINRITQSQIK